MAELLTGGSGKCMQDMFFVVLIGIAFGLFLEIALSLLGASIYKMVKVMSAPVE